MVGCKNMLAKGPKNGEFVSEFNNIYHKSKME